MQNDLPVHKSQLLKEYSSIDARLRPLIMLVKAWSKARGINSAPQGTLNSFAYCVLVLHFLQRLQPPILPVLTSPRLELRGEALLRAQAAGLPEVLVLLGHCPRFVVGVNVDHHKNAYLPEGWRDQVRSLPNRWHDRTGVLADWGSENESSPAVLLASFFGYYAKVRDSPSCD